MATTTTRSRSETKPAGTRAPRGKGKAGPGVAKAAAAAAIDLTQPNARKALLALHPKPTNELFVDATPEAEKSAQRYFAERAVEKAAGAAKELAGTELCAAIGGSLGVRGDGWRATWDEKDGSVDWKALAVSLGATEAQIAKFRAPPTRALDVREVAEGGE